MPTPRKTPTDGGHRPQQVRETLKVLLRYSEMNQSELARRTNMGRANVQQKLSGRTAITVDDLFAFADALEVPIGTLFLSPQAAAQWHLDTKGVATITPLDRRRRRASSGQSGRTKRVAGGRARTAANRRQGGLSPASPKGQLPVQFGPRPNLRVVTCA